MEPSTAATKRRIFFGSGDESFHIFSITQNKNGGDIYFSSPKFGDIEWRAPALNADQEMELLAYQAEDQDKLSLHASGIVHLPYKSTRPDEFRISGSMLSNTDSNNLGVRHLLTIFLSEPTHKPESPALSRKTDGVMTTSQWHPYVLVLWALPALSTSTITVKFTLSEDDLEEIPPNAGWGAFHMQQHIIVWMAYRTKHMDRWPANSQACYADGYTVPLFIGTGEGQLRVEYRFPTYSCIGNDFVIDLHGSVPKS